MEIERGRRKKDQILQNKNQERIFTFIDGNRKRKKKKDQILQIKNQERIFTFIDGNRKRKKKKGSNFANCLKKDE